MSDEPQTNEAGYIAIRKYQDSPQLVQVGETAEYLFMVQHFVSLAWVAPKHVGYVLGLRSGCNCSSGRGAPLFHLANERDIRVWNGTSSR
jgi:hypothetical protein